MPRLFGRLVGIAGFTLAIGSMASFVAFLAGVGWPRGIDDGDTGALAVWMDLALVASFGLVHSGLARRRVRELVARRVGEANERSVYSVVAGLQIVALIAFWQPLPEVVWRLDSVAARSVVWTLFAAGWALVLWALASVDGSQLFGLRRAWSGTVDPAAASPPLVARGPYRLVRHPLYAATLLALFAAPTMSRGRLLLAAGFAVYIAIGVRFEERDLVRAHGEAYRAYRERVPGFLPRLERQPPGARQL